MTNLWNGEKTGLTPNSRRRFLEQEDQFIEYYSNWWINMYNIFIKVQTCLYKKKIFILLKNFELYWVFVK